MSGFLRKSFIFLLSAVYLVGCGGSGVNDSGAGTTNPDGSTTPPAKVITLKLVKVSDGTATNTISPSSPGKVQISVTNASATELVTLTTTVGTLEPANGAVLLVNGAGEAVIKAGTTAGAGEITATLKSGESKSLPFAVGAANITLKDLVVEPNTSLSAGGQATITAQLVDEAGAPFTEPLKVSFVSGCSSASPATATLDTDVTTVAGKAVSTYKANGCSGDDTVTASANLGGSTLSKAVKLTINPASVGSIQFVKAEPVNIALRGTGGSGRSEVSNVLFKVKDSLGNPVPNRTVSFVLNTTVGGLTVNAQGISNSLGEVTAVVNAGTIPTPVRVTASVDTPSGIISTLSDQLVVSTGVPTQERLSIALDNINVEAMSRDGIEVKVTARLADRFGNPAPKDTAVAFRSEVGGAIDPQCLTNDAGACTVTWRSQGNRPTDGRVSLLATAVGEESFVDSNSNGQFEAAEIFTDLPEAFLNVNQQNFTEAVVYDAGIDEFIDFNSNGSYDAADGKFNGLLCNGNCSDNKTLHVRAHHMLQLSVGRASVVLNPASVTVTPNSEAAISFSITDADGRAMASGTKVDCITTNGTLVGTSSFTIPGTGSVSAYTGSCTIKGDSTSSVGSFRVKVTSVSGLITESDPVTVND